MELIKPDLERCQTEWLGGSFMTLGPRPTVRCEKRPVVIATEKIQGKDGLRGSMSLCGEHMDDLQRIKPEFCVFKMI